MNDPSPFPQDALEANRAGKLTQAQRVGWRRNDRGLRKTELQFALFITILGLVVWFATGPSKDATLKPLIGIGCLIIAGFLVVRSFLGADPLTQDLRSGRVETVEGAITKTSVSAHSRGSSSTSYYFTVAGTRVSVGLAAYQAAPEAGMVRLYYLPHSHHLVNMERIADTSLSQETMRSPEAVREIMKEAFHSHDPNQAAEARAHLATMGDVIKSAASKATAPPAAASRYSRPLAEAILGTWGNAMMSVTFAADGSLTADMPAMGGGSRRGHWSVDSTGHLVSDVMGGGAMPTDAWVSGDELTVNIGTTGLTLQRQAG